MNATIEKLFGFDPKKHNVRTELMAGITTFLTMAYILAVNPGIFSALPGLTAFSAAMCFVLAMFFSPLFLAIPSAATAPALIIVGVMMMPAIKRIHWEDYCKAIPAFLTIILMPLAYSISDGILIGVISYVACHMVAGKFNQISITMWVLAVLFVCKYLFI